MLKIKIAAIGKLNGRALTELSGEYVKRLSRYCTLEIIELRDESISARASWAEIQKHLSIEAGLVIERLRQDAYVIALDMGGKAPDSVEFSKLLNLQTGTCSEIVFVIGGSHGLHQRVLARADYVLSI